jgi:diacylglycerol kinase family enzyme
LPEKLANGLRRSGLRAEITLGLAEFGEKYVPATTKAPLRCVVAVGGDGTVAAIANITQGQVPIAILPTGTENLLATRLGLHRDIPALVQMIIRGSTTRLDVGRANGRVFLVMFSCGFDAEVVRQVHERRQGPISRWSYAEPIWRALRTYRFPPIQTDGLSADGQPADVSLEGHWVFAFNLNCYARGLRIAREADPQDGKLDVCVLWSPSLFNAVFHFFTVVARCQGRWSGFRRMRCSRLRIDSQNHQRVPYQIDGELGGDLPVELEVLPKWVPLVVPEAGGH